MKELVSKLWDIFKKDPIAIVSVLAMDIVGIVFLSFFDLTFFIIYDIYEMSIGRYCSIRYPVSSK